MNVAHLKGISNLGVVKNPEYAEPWLRAIGSYMLNFGSIELLSYKYLDYLESTEEEFLVNTNKLLGARISRIEALIKLTNLQQKEEVLEVWSVVRKLSKWRNRIAHNPVLPTWKPGSDRENSTPDVLGVSDMKQISKENKTTDSISLKGLGMLNDETVKIAEKLNELCESIKQP